MTECEECSVPLMFMDAVPKWRTVINDKGGTEKHPYFMCKKCKRKENRYERQKADMA